MPIRFLAALVVILFGAIWQPAAGATADDSDADVIVAHVDAEPIRIRDIDLGIPRGVTGADRQRARSIRLAKLVELTALRHQIARLGVVVDSQAVEREFAAWSRRPLPAAGDPCCGSHAVGGYVEYLEENFLTVADVKDELASGLAITAYATATWNASHHGKEGRDAVIRVEGPVLRARLCHLWCISFPCSYDEVTDNLLQRGPAWRKALAALDRLRDGDDFAVVAHGAGESRDDMGFFPLELLGAYGIDARHLMALAPGTVSDPIPCANCYRLLKWQPLGDEDIIAVTRQRFIDSMRADITKEAAAKCLVRHVGIGIARREPLQP